LYWEFYKRRSNKCNGPSRGLHIKHTSIKAMNERYEKMPLKREQFFMPYVVFRRLYSLINVEGSA
ncbi:hypothetical protein, partial [Bacillus thuringiensis]|uniref:hypothetical protein n=1 Tax=Bacillus thuringiensis TaxID=1428 RepID=UPI001C92F592